MSAPLAILASGSPRRGAILRAAGVDFLTMVPAIDDADAPSDGRDPARYVMGLAWFKAQQASLDARARLGDAGPRWIVAADTMCVRDGEVIGKPADAPHAERMLRAFRGRDHEVVTGICILDRACGGRRIFSDAARVSLGALPDELLAEHVAAGRWRGKAGGYNYADCVEAGWPLRCDGDPETVMGLPSRLVVPMLRDGAAG